MDNKEMLQMNYPCSWGKFNALLYFRYNQQILETLYTHIVTLFKPDEITYSALDPEDTEIAFFDTVPFPFKSNSLVNKIIFNQEKESIILDFFNDEFILEHCFRPDFIHDINGHQLLKQQFSQEDFCVLTLGYELSIFVESYKSTFEENISNPNSYPIYVVKKNGGKCLIDEYSFKNQVIDQQSEVIKEYISNVIGNGCG